MSTFFKALGGNTAMGVVGGLNLHVGFTNLFEGDTFVGVIGVAVGVLITFTGVRSELR